MDTARSSAGRSLPARVSKAVFLVSVASLGIIQIPFTNFNIVATDVIFLAGGGIWVVTLVFRQSRVRWHNFYWLLIFYIVALTTSCYLSENQLTSFERLPAEVYLVGLCVLTFNMLEKRDDVRQAVCAWLIGAGFAAMVGLITIPLFYFTPQSSLLDFLTYHYGAVPVGDYPRITATFVSASMLCNYLNAALIVALAGKAAGWLNEKLAWALIITSFVCSVFTISVGLGGVFLGLGVWFWYLSRESHPAESRVALATGITAAVAFLVLAIFALTPYPGGKTISTLPFIDYPVMASGRVLVWRDAIQTFAERPITGKGLGLPVANVIFPNSEGSLSLLTDAHNSFLSVAAQNGIVGLAAFALIVLALVRRWIRPGPLKPIIFGIGLAIFCSFVYQGLTGSFENARHLWILIGIFLAADSMQKDAPS